MIKEKSGWRIALKAIIIIICTVLVIGIGYVIYAFASYYRLPDHLTLEVHQKSSETAHIETADTETEFHALKTGTCYRIGTYNVGFGAYTPDFSFFMDGGTESWAFSKESCKDTIVGAINHLKSQNLDIMFVQEVDVDSTRSYHLNQVQMVTKGFPEYNWVFAQNYDSPFLIYPFHQPHGASKAGLVTMSKYDISYSVRRSFPVSQGFSKMIDLDRCFSVSVIPIDNGKNLRVINLHMSAYGSDDSIRKGQISLLIEEMKAAHDAGDYVICGGDFNHDLSLTEDAETITSWAYPFPRSELPEYLKFAFDGMSDEEKAALGKSSRDDDTGYQPGITGEYLLDGFIISDNVKVNGYRVIDSDYAFSDHEIVVMDFELID